MCKLSDRNRFINIKIIDYSLMSMYCTVHTGWGRIYFLIALIGINNHYLILHKKLQKVNIEDFIVNMTYLRTVIQL